MLATIRSVVRSNFVMRAFSGVDLSGMGSFDILPLKQDDHGMEVVTKMAEWYVLARQEPVSVALGLKKEDWAEFAKNWMFERLGDGLSCAIVFEGTGQVVSGLCCEDFADPLPEMMTSYGATNDSFKYYIELLDKMDMEYCDTKQRGVVPGLGPRGKVAQMLMETVDPAFRGYGLAEYHMQFLDKKLKKKGYEYVIFPATSLATHAARAAQDLGFDKAVTQEYRSFVAGDGSKPFEGVPDNEPEFRVYELTL